MPRLITIRIPADLWRWVGYRSADTGQPKGAIVAEALGKWLDAPGEAGAGRIGPSITTSANLDEGLHAKLMETATDRGVSAAEIVRAAVKKALDGCGPNR